MTNTTTAATVETLTAEVRTLVVGSRQVTLSVAKQLDVIPLARLELMGRVRIDKDDTDHSGWAIGRDARTGSLALSKWDYLTRPELLVSVDDGIQIMACQNSFTQSDVAYIRWENERFLVWNPKRHEACECPAGTSCGWSVEPPESMEFGYEVLRRKVAERDAIIAKHEAATYAPLIVLAGLK